jgi:hypothetical protein
MDATTVEVAKVYQERISLLLWRLAQLDAENAALRDVSGASISAEEYLGTVRELEERMRNLGAENAKLLALVKIVPIYALHPADERGPCLCSQCQFVSKRAELTAEGLL